jgi:hypothetical protein
MVFNLRSLAHTPVRVGRPRSQALPPGVQTACPTSRLRLSSQVVVVRSMPYVLGASVWADAV